MISSEPVNKAIPRLELTELPYIGMLLAGVVYAGFSTGL